MKKIAASDWETTKTDKQIKNYLAQLDSREHNSEFAAEELRRCQAAERAGESPWPAAEGGWLRPGMFRTAAAAADAHGVDESSFLHSWLID